MMILSLICSVSLEIPSLSLGMTGVNCDYRHCEA